MKAAHDIAVVGAGIAGLSCATALQSAGHRVQVFDKSGGTSGRVSTRRGDGWQCDHGAQYFAAEHPEFVAEIARWQQAGVVAPWKPRLRIEGGAQRRARGNGTWHVGVPRMTAPARWLAGACALSTKTTINRVSQVGQRWQLQSAEHGVMAQMFDTVVLAIPAPQAVPLLRGAASELSRLADGVAMQGCWALMARFAAPLALDFDAAVCANGPLAWVARDNSKPGRNGTETWLMHAGTEWSETHIEADADFVGAALIEAFRVLGGETPQAWTAHRWRYASGAVQLPEGCAWRAESGIGLCGDWLNGGDVEGAWLSGRALAAQILQSTQTQTSGAVHA
jgi:predicted NAD/FAD-dependent oxidoreductase